MRRLCLSLFTIALLPISFFGRGDERTDPIKVADYKKPIRVACVGDSITFGFGWNDPRSYPSQLGKLLGEDWTVRNFGVGGRTMLRKGDFPYWKEKAFKDAQGFQPNVVILMLGTNDTKPWNWRHKDDFAADYKEMVERFEHLPSKPRVFCCLPPPVPGKGNYGINETGIDAEIPLIREVAKDTAAGTVNMHAALERKPELLPDRVHPNARGYELMAEAAYKRLTGNK